MIWMIQRIWKIFHHFNVEIGTKTAVGGFVVSGIHPLQAYKSATCHSLRGWPFVSGSVP